MSTSTTTNTATTTRYSIRVLDPDMPGIPPIYAVDDRAEDRTVKYTRVAWDAEALCRDLNAGACGPPASPYGGNLPDLPPPVAEAVGELMAAWEPPTTDEEADMEPAEGESPDDGDDPLLGTEVIIPGLDRVGLSPEEWDGETRVTTGPLASPEGNLLLDLAAVAAVNELIGPPPAEGTDDGDDDGGHGRDGGSGVRTTRDRILTDAERAALEWVAAEDQRGRLADWHDTCCRAARTHGRESEHILDGAYAVDHLETLWLIKAEARPRARGLRITAAGWDILRQSRAEDFDDGDPDGGEWEPAGLVSLAAAWAALALATAWAALAVAGQLLGWGR